MTHTCICVSELGKYWFMSIDRCQIKPWVSDDFFRGWGWVGAGVGLGAWVWVCGSGGVVVDEQTHSLDTTHRIAKVYNLDCYNWYFIQTVIAVKFYFASVRIVFVLFLSAQNIHVFLYCIFCYRHTNTWSRDGCSAWDQNLFIARLLW